MKTVAEYYARKPGPTQVFGAPRDGGKRKHRGRDTSWSKTPGTPVPALLGGKVIGKLAPSKDNVAHGFGHQVTIESVFDGVKETLSYAHGRVASPLTVGQVIAAGDMVLEEGTTGSVTGSCMHLERLRAGAYIDPQPLIDQVLKAPLAPNERRVMRAVKRRQIPADGIPSTAGVDVQPANQPGQVIAFVGWMLGENHRGDDGVQSDIWLIDRNGLASWEGCYSPRGVDGLTNLNPAPDPRIEELIASNLALIAAVNKLIEQQRGIYREAS